MRGDVDANGRLNVADAVFVLQELFAGRSSLTCEDAADVDNSGEIDLTDATRLLAYLFAAGPSAAEPHTVCGIDGSRENDPLGCVSAPQCLLSFYGLLMEGDPSVFVIDLSGSLENSASPSRVSSTS